MKFASPLSLTPSRGGDLRDATFAELRAGGLAGCDTTSVARLAKWEDLSVRRKIRDYFRRLRIGSGPRARIRNDRVDPMSLPGTPSLSSR
jgi:hypothetical protein